MEEKKEKKRLIKKFKYTKKEKLLIAALSALSVTFVLLIFSPIDIYANNMAEFQFCFYDVLKAMALPFLIGFVGLTALLYIFPPLMLNVASSFVFSFLLSTYIDNLILHTTSFVSGDMVVNSDTKTTLSVILWLIVIYALMFTSIFIGKSWRRVIIYLSVLMIGMNGASLVADSINNRLFSDTSFNIDYAITDKDITKLSEGENIIYILFDRFDRTYYDEVVEAYPDYFDDLEGFTFFDDCTSKYNRTFPAVTNLFTGIEFDTEKDKSSEDYFRRAYAESPFIKDLQDNGYSMNLYFTRYYEYNDAVLLKDIAGNAERVDGYSVKKKSLMKYFLRQSLSRINHTYYSVVSLMYENGGVHSKLSELNCENTEYVANEPKYYKQLKSKGLSTTKNEKQFTFLVTDGVHSPFFLNEKCEYDPENATSLSQTVGAFNMVKEYLNQLKELGIYDNSTIIITGDHGRPYSDISSWDKYFGSEVDEGIRTCTFFKPKNATNDKLLTSSAPVCIDNIIPTIVKDAGINTTHDYGKGLFDVKPDEQNDRYIYHSICDLNSRTLTLEEYKISGSAKNLDNWTLTSTNKTDFPWH